MRYNQFGEMDMNLSVSPFFAFYFTRKPIFVKTGA